MRSTVAMTKKLTQKQERFVEEYPKDSNATQAAIRAGYSPRTADSQASRLLTHVKVRERVQKLMKSRSKRTEITADDVFKELSKMGFGNVANLYDDKGKLLHPKDMPRDVSATITEVTEERIGGGGKDDDSFMVRRKYKVADKRASLVDMGRHLKMFTDKVEHDVSEMTIQQLSELASRG